MSIANGQGVNAAESNAAWMSRKNNTDTVGKVDLKNAATTELIDTQRVQNDIMDTQGSTHQAATDANAKNYANENVITDGDNRKTAIEKLDATFDPATGHTHDGSDSTPIDGNDLIGINQLTAQFDTTTFNGANGTSDDVSANFIGKAETGAEGVVGVITSPPNNKVDIIDPVNLDRIEDIADRRVFGRLTFAGGVWTISYFVIIAGVETSLTLPGGPRNIQILFREVRNQSNRKTITPEIGVFESPSFAADIQDANSSQRGLMSAAAQSFGGDKNFNGALARSGDDVLSETTAGTVTNKLINLGSATVTNRIIPSGNTDGNLALIPSNAGALYRSDDTFRPVWDSGSGLENLAYESELGSGGSGAGDLDTYFTETVEDLSDTTSFTTGNNASFLGGGVLAGTFEIETVAPLSGTQSLKFTQAAGSLNDFVASEIIPVDLKHRGKEHAMSFDFLYDGLDSDIRLVIYDVTNAQELVVNGFELEAATDSIKKNITYFLPETTLEIRWGFQVSVLNNGAVFIIDDISMTSNPFVVAENLVQITEWKSYNLTIGSLGTAPTKGTVVNDNAKWRRVGDSMEISYSYEQTAAGVAGTSFYTFSIPPGFTIDNSKITVDADGDNGNVGSASAFSSAETPTRTSGIMSINNATSLFMMLAGDNIVTSTVFDLADTAIQYSFMVTIPIIEFADSGPHIITPMRTNLSEWESFTPTGTWTTNTTYSGLRKRIGDSEKYRIRIDLSGAPNSTFLAIDIANGNNIDLAKVFPEASGRNITFGQGSLRDTGTGTLLVRVGYISATQVRVHGMDPTGVNTDGIQATTVDESTPFTFTSGDFIFLEYEVPIVEFANAPSTFLAAIPAPSLLKAQVNGNQAVPGSTAPRIDFNVVKSETTSDFSIVTGASWLATYNGSKTKKFAVSMQGAMFAQSAALNQFFESEIIINGVHVASPLADSIKIGTGSPVTYNIGFSAHIVTLKPGDNIYIRYDNTGLPNGSTIFGAFGGGAIDVTALNIIQIGVV